MFLFTAIPSDGDCCGFSSPSSLCCSSVVTVVGVVVAVVVVVVVAVAVAVVCVVVGIVVVVVFPLITLFVELPSFARDILTGARSLLGVAASNGSGEAWYRARPNA